MATRTPAEQLTVDDVVAELKALEDPKIRTVNQRHGNDMGVNLTKLRGIAKRLKTQHDFVKELWTTDDAQARLIAILISSRKNTQRISWTQCYVKRGSRKCLTGWSTTS